MERPPGSPAAGTAEAAVIAERLVRRFGTVLAVDAVSFDVGRGELFGVIGPDGAGKTTLFRLLATLLVPDAGGATVLGHDVVRELWAVRRHVGYMPGRFSLYRDLSVQENLRFFASVFGTRLEDEVARIGTIYRQLEPFRDRRAGALSGGMQQKLALCCALVHRPELLLLDEPTTGVDAVSRREFWDVLGELRSAGTTIIVSTPYMDEARRCDRVALMQRGRIFAIDTPRGLAESFDRPLFAVHASDRYRVLRALRAYPHAQSVQPFGDVLHFTDARATAPPDRVADEATAWLRARGFTEVALTPIPAGVEDVFMARMGAPETPRGEAT